MKLAEGTFGGLAGQEIELFRRFLTGAEGVGVEIGCMDGFSTAHLLECSKLHITSIDPFIPDSMAAHLVGQEQRYHENIAPWKDRATLLKAYSWDVVVSWNQMLDFLFIDGDHTYASVLRDYEQWTPLLKPGGLLAMHDSRMGREGGATFHMGPSQVAREYVYGKPERWEIVGEAFSLTVARKRV
jgi:predicted O-methyltransferase YrrM